MNQNYFGISIKDESLNNDSGDFSFQEKQSTPNSGAQNHRIQNYIIPDQGRLQRDSGPAEYTTIPISTA